MILFKPSPQDLNIGSNLLAGTAGSILFVDSSKNLAQNNSNLFWDATNARFALGNTAPPTRLTVVGLGETTTISDSGNKAATIRVATSGGSVGDGGIIEFGAGIGSYTQSYFSAIRGLLASSANNTTGNLGFYVRNVSTDSSLTLKMSISNTGVGIATSTPGEALDVNGRIRTRSTNVSCSNGANDNLSLPATGFAFITGPSAAFNISGVVAANDGTILTLYNATGYNMTINNESASSTAANRILTLTGDITTTGTGCVTLQYSSGNGRWVVIASNL